MTCTSYPYLIHVMEKYRGGRWPKIRFCQFCITSRKLRRFLVFHMVSQIQYIKATYYYWSIWWQFFFALWQFQWILSVAIATFMYRIPRIPFLRLFILQMVTVRFCKKKFHDTFWRTSFVTPESCRVFEISFQLKLSPVVSIYKAGIWKWYSRFLRPKLEKSA